MIKFSVSSSRSGFNLSVVANTSEIRFHNVSLEFISRMVRATDDKCMSIELNNSQSTKLQSMIRCG